MSDDDRRERLPWPFNLNFEDDNRREKRITEKLDAILAKLDLILQDRSHRVGGIMVQPGSMKESPMTASAAHTKAVAIANTATSLKLNGVELFSMVVMDSNVPPVPMSPQPAPDAPPVWALTDVTIGNLVVDPAGVAPSLTGIKPGTTELSATATFGASGAFTGVCDVTVNPDLSLSISGVTIIPGAIS